MAIDLRTVVLATTNRGKLADFQHLLAGTGIELVLPLDRGVLRMDVEETGATFEENALMKARALAAATGLPALGDDSGLVVAALGGAPGIYSARYAGPQCDDRANNHKLIEELAGIADRSAAFVCALALVLPDRTELVTRGTCEGRVIDEERGTNGFGYDAVFYREDLGHTFGEASRAEKNARSHRGAAARALLAELRARALLPERGRVS